MAESKDGTSNILQGVERISWCTTHVLCFPGALAAAMRFLGEDVSNEYVLGTSGGAFKLFWLSPWAPSNCDLLVIGGEAVQHAFAALGYSYRYLPDYDAEEHVYSRDFYRHEIVRSVDAGKPVIAIGVIGPPEACLITGYEKSGEVLHGTSYFEESETGFFRTADWYGNIRGMILIGHRRERPEPRQVLEETLGWAVRLARMPSFGERAWSGPETRQPALGLAVYHHANGLAAFDMMAEMLRRDEEFIDLSPQDFEMRCFAIGHDGVCLLGPERIAAAEFLESFADEGFAGSDELRKAAAAYREEAAVLKEAEALAPMTFRPEEQNRFLMERPQRMRLAGLLCEAKSKEETAVEHLEAALAALRA